MLGATIQAVYFQLGVKFPSRVPTSLKIIPIMDARVELTSVAARTVIGAISSRRGIGGSWWLFDNACMAYVGKLSASAGVSVQARIAAVFSVAGRTLLGAIGAATGAAQVIEQVKAKAFMVSPYAGATSRISAVSAMAHTLCMQARGVLNPSDEEVIFIVRHVLQRRGMYATGD